MKRLIRKEAYDASRDVREFAIPTTPLYPSLSENYNSEYKDSPFYESDKKSYQKMFNDFSLSQSEKRKNK